MTQKPYSDADLLEVSDHPPWTDEQLAAAKPFSTIFPLAAASMRRGRGPQKAPTKVKVNIRLDQDVLDHFRSLGPGWQSEMNQFLAANKTVLRMIDQNEDLLEGMESLLKHVRSGELRMAFEGSEATIAGVERDLRNVTETTRGLRERLKWSTPKDVTIS